MGPRSRDRGYVDRARLELRLGQASMGPRSRDRGYGHAPDQPLGGGAVLQWVHGHVTVVTQVVYRLWRGVGVASMGPRSRDRGYGLPARLAPSPVVLASMGPRSRDRGYV